MKKKNRTVSAAIDNDELLAEYCFDYRKARRNRFAPAADTVTRTVVLDPEVAIVFPDSDSVNAELRPKAKLLLQPDRITPAIRKRQQIAQRYQDAVRRARSAVEPDEKKRAWQEAEARRREWVDFLNDSVASRRPAKTKRGITNKKN